MPYVTPEGLQIPTVESLLEDVAAEQRGSPALGPDLDTSPDSPVGQFNGITGSHIREAWEALALVFNSLDPDTAEGFLLENISAITGTFRARATRSTFAGARKLRLTLAANKTIPAGTIFEQAGNSAVRFRTVESVSSTTAGDYFTSAEALEPGPVICNAGTLTVIVTAVNGLAAVVNDHDAVIGYAGDNDEALRARRVRELRGIGASTIEAIAARVSRITIDNKKPVEDARAFENTRMEVNAQGLPPKSFEVVLFDGIVPAVDNDTIAQTIWSAKPAGIQPYGNAFGFATDGRGEKHRVPFSRVAVRAIKAEIVIVYEAGAYAGDSAVKDAVVRAFLTERKIGHKVRPGGMYCAALDVAGVVEISSLRLGFVGAPLLTHMASLPLSIREIANLDTGEIVIVSAPEP